MGNISRLAKYAWVVLIYNIFVILWGAYVRATGSGAGCGSHWPLCNGVVIPRAAQVETIIEFTHRLSSGLALILVVILFILVFRKYPRKHIVRLGATLSLVFIITEALVGAGLVLFEWVAGDASVGRVISMAVHLVNTFLLLAVLTLTAWWASSRESISFRNKGVGVWAFGMGLIGVLFVGVSGAITALGDTLFPVGSLAEGLQQDFSATAHFVIRLRVWHPIIAIIVGAYLFLLSGIIAMYANDERKVIYDGEKPAEPLLERHYRFIKLFAFILIGAVAIQLIAGLINLLLLAPVWMQIIHLFLADLTWISLVLLTANTFSKLAASDVVSEIDAAAQWQGKSDLKLSNNIIKYTDPSAEQY